MSKVKKIFLYLLLGVFVLIQFYPSDQPEVTAVNPNDLLKNEAVPENIASMLRSACYDCHSNESTFAHCNVWIFA